MDQVDDEGIAMKWKCITCRARDVGEGGRREAGGESCARPGLVVGVRIRQVVRWPGRMNDVGRSVARCQASSWKWKRGRWRWAGFGWYQGRGTGARYLAAGRERVR